MARMIYLASPYSHESHFVREQRFQWACKVAAALMRAGHIVFSPIAHTHMIAKHGSIRQLDWSFWKGQDMEFVSRCDEVWVLKIPGWEQSVGVGEEIKFAESQGKPVVYLEFNEEEL